ncbi:hypothetical protein H5410_031054 [Solanum commersonii]|uniref:Polyprotein protein n=1 Tax=Solanum commersonii TaxID=4109 RepID=A0A9J5YKJ2_SOLCO|nr:hypothetical protein H5410_031054 [Solanum commersonii]
MIFGMVEISDVPNILSATTGDNVRVEEVVEPESEAETDEEILRVAEDVSYEGLTTTKEATIDATVQTSLANMPLADLSKDGDTVDVTPGTDTQVQSTTPSTNAPTDGATI